MSSGLMRASAVMASGTMVSRLLGFVKAILLAYAIGLTASISADAFTVGNSLPNTLYMILLGGMLNAVLVPQIVAAARNADGGHSYINKVVTLVTVSLVVLTALMMLFAPWLVRIFALTWTDDQLALATAFAYWCIPQIVFYGLYAVLGEVLNARSVFGPFTWSPVINNVVSIAGIGVFIAMFGADPGGARVEGDWTGMAVAVLAGSATLGVVGQALILLVSWRKAGLKFRPDFKWRGVGLAQTGRLAGWSLATIGTLQLVGWLATNVVNTASGTGPSSGAMQTAWLIFMLPHSVIAVSLATAYFTRLSEWGQNGRMVEFRADFAASARIITVVMVLASVMVFVAADFVSRVMQVGGTQEQVEQFAQVLRAYMLSLAGYSFLFIVQRAFYALSDTRRPFYFTLVQGGVLVLLCIFVLMVPKELRGAAYGIAWSIATLAQAFVATWMLRRRIGSIHGRSILQSIVRSLIAAIPALAVGYPLAIVLLGLMPASGTMAVLAAIAFALVTAAVVSVLYFAALWLLKSPELRTLADRVRRRA